MKNYKEINKMTGKQIMMSDKVDKVSYHDRCIFCDKKRVYTHAIKIPPLSCNVGNKNQTVCYKCYDTVYTPMKSKYRELFIN